MFLFLFLFSYFSFFFLIQPKQREKKDVGTIKFTLELILGDEFIFFFSNGEPSSSKKRLKSIINFCVMCDIYHIYIYIYMCVCVYKYVN